MRKIITLTGKKGLNVKASITLCNLAQQFNCTLVLANESIRVNPKSLLGLLSLDSPSGTELEITAEGKDAETALFAISNLFQEKFGESD